MFLHIYIYIYIYIQTLQPSRLSLFHSPYEFLVLEEGDPRVKALRARVAGDTLDAGLAVGRRLVEVPLSPEAARLGARWVWQQVSESSPAGHTLSPNYFCHIKTKH
jgi:hypothetical protein